MEFLLVPMILFLVVVAPVWLTMHYRYKTKMAKGISEQEVHDLEDMLETLDKVMERVETLEEILDEEHPGWRKSNKKRY